MLSIARRIGTVLAVALPLLLAPSAATAGPGSGGIECDTADPNYRPKPGCTAKAGTPGTNKGTSGQDGNGSGDQSNSGSGGDDGCTYRRTYPSAATAAALRQPSGDGGWYFKTCFGVNSEIAFEGPIWIAGGPPTVSPETLAREARSRLELPDVVIRLNPSGDQLVNLPVWLALDPASWKPQSATASVPGVSVTATARPVKANWSMGDGTTVTCTGPGTAWTPGTDPAKASPDCGHVYRRPSANAPGGVYPVAITVTWEVTWAGAGQSGTVPGLTTTGQVQTRVQESQAVIS